MDLLPARGVPHSHQTGGTAGCQVPSVQTERSLVGDAAKWQSRHLPGLAGHPHTNLVIVTGDRQAFAVRTERRGVHVVHVLEGEPHNLLAGRRVPDMRRAIVARCYRVAAVRAE